MGFCPANPKITDFSIYPVPNGIYRHVRGNSETDFFNPPAQWSNTSANSCILRAEGIELRKNIISVRIIWVAMQLRNMERTLIFIRMGL